MRALLAPALIRKMDESTKFLPIGLLKNVGLVLYLQCDGLRVWGLVQEVLLFEGFKVYRVWDLRCIDAEGLRFTGFGI